jgi:SAM-dependent methyltransferase
MSPKGVQPRRKQDRNYWDTMAARWDDEIFNTLHHDRSRVIAGEIERSSRQARSVADFGCGTGIYLPLLSRLFEQVEGFERSTACVAIARDNVRRRRNVAVHSATSASIRRRGAFDVALCVNVAVHPAPRARASVLRSLRTLLNPGGRLILVVPSLESAIMVATAERDALRRRSARRQGDWGAAADPDGVVTIEGMPYKHYARNELRRVLDGAGFIVSRIRRVEYSWRSQGVSAGSSVRRTLPWDWIAVANRVDDAASDQQAIAA